MRIFLTAILSSILTLGCVLSLGCPPQSYPPRLRDVCTGDGVGGADCRTPEQVSSYRAPSELKNWWMVSQEDAAALVSWCYGVNETRAARMVAQYMKPYKAEAVE